MKKKETIKASLVYVGNFGNNKVFIDGTEGEAKDLAYYIKRGIEAVKMLDEQPILKPKKQRNEPRTNQN